MRNWGEMNVLQANPSDVQLLAGFNRQLILDERHRNRMSVEELEVRMREWLAAEYDAYIFTRDSVPVGYVLFRTDDDFVYVRQFFIVTECRQQGVGRKAFEWMATHVWKHDRIRLDVLWDNSAGVAFWKALGFEEYCITMEIENRNTKGREVSQE
ncbi:MAG: GNAT family N-acetyltransferase [Planctomycetota bacterium]